MRPLERRPPADEHPQRDSNPCRLLERVKPTVSGVVPSRLEPEFTARKVA
jgi:hypothetical protein